MFYLNDGKRPMKSSVFDNMGIGALLKGLNNSYSGPQEPNVGSLLYRLNNQDISSTAPPPQPPPPYDWNSALTGVKQGLGGVDAFGNQVPGMIPGGGILAGVGQMAGGVADLLSYNKRMDEQRVNLGAAQKNQASFRRLEKAGVYDPKVAQAQRDLAMAGVRPTDTSGIKSAAQTAFQAMQGDPRLAASQMGSIMRNQAQMEQQQKVVDTQREIASMSNLANLEQSALDQKIGLDRQLGLMGLGMAYDAEAQAKQNMEALKDARRGAVGNILGGAVNTGIGIASGGMAANGAKVQKTPGEFSHRTNPIDIMKDGAKVGEMTGGEYIINPEQANSIKSARDAIKNGSKKPADFNRLYKIIDKILSQPQFA